MKSRPRAARIRSLRLLLLDVDGVLTDGKIYLGPGSFELKSFHVHDGLGIKLLEEAGIRVGFLSNRKSLLVVRRARELGVRIVQTGLADKVAAYEKLKRKLLRNPRSVRFGDLVRVLSDLGYSEVRSRGSHHVFRPPGLGPSLLIVKPHGGRVFCAEVDVKKVLEILEERESKNAK